jgi:hypothetical protein
MGRRPIIIPRHQSQQPKPCLSGANGLVLAHPLALMNISGVEIEIEEESSGSGSSIGIRRHGQPLQPQRNGSQFSTPEKKKNNKRSRMVRKRSPTSILLPLDFIEEEVEEEEEERYRQTITNKAKTDKGGITKNSATMGDGDLSSAVTSSLFRTERKEEEPESVLSGGAVMNSSFVNKTENDECDDFFSNNNRETVDDVEERLSEYFDTSDFGSVIEHVNESDDFGHDLVVLPNEDDELDEDDDRSTGTFSEMMLQQEEQFASMLTTSAGSSILTTSTLERSLEQKRKQFQLQQKNGGNPPLFGEFPMQRILQAAVHNSQKNENDRGKNNNINNNNMKNALVIPTLSHRPLMLPEEQRRAALVRYRYNQIIHTKSHGKRNDWQNLAASARKSESNPKDKYQQLVYSDLEQIMGKEEKEQQPLADHENSFQEVISSEDSFASTMNDELRSLKNSTLLSNESFRKAATRLSRDLYESNARVTMLEAELEAAKKQRELCRERHGFVKAKREKEKELTAIRTLHLEILGNGGTNERARRMLLEHRKHEIPNTLHRQQQHDANKKNLEGAETPGDANTSIPSTSPGLIFAGSRREKYFKESHRVVPPKNQPEAAAAMERKEGDNNNDAFYRRKSIEELRAIKNRLEVIKDLFDKARYIMVSSENKSESSQTDTLRKQHQSQVMIENAVSKYILFRTKSLV